MRVSEGRPNHPLQLTPPSVTGQLSGVVRGRGEHVGNVNRKASRDEMAHAYRAIKEAFPDWEPVFGGHGDYGGHRAPRDRTISFRLRDGRGKYRSNVVWVLPEYLASLTPGAVRALVSRANGDRRKRRG